MLRKRKFKRVLFILIVKCFNKHTNHIQDLFHVYLNKCEFQCLCLHINKTNTVCFLIDNGRATGTTK